MFIITGKKITTLGNEVYEFMSGLYPNLTEVDIEVIPTDLTEDNVFGWTLENNDQTKLKSITTYRIRILLQPLYTN